MYSCQGRNGKAMPSGFVPTGLQHLLSFGHVSVQFSPLCLHVVTQSSFLNNTMNNVSNICLILKLKVLCYFRSWERLVSMLVNTIDASNKVTALSYNS